ncbi:MAG: UDP-3-O-acyl-N-acetylglucosamine deacetylase [Bacillota bacterium]|nr:UDP-3-O-acyl-N-acetylglucosamine deacetylase [Bacillota bacterium]
MQEKAGTGGELVPPEGGRRQRTVARPVALEGVGLHTGLPARMKILPAGAGEGILFCRTDRPEKPPVPADPEHLVAGRRCTALGWGTEEAVQTVEHLLAALRGLEVDNARVELDGPEVPAGDGSAAVYVRLLEEDGLVELPEPRRWLRLRQPLAVSAGEAHLVALPAEELRVTYVFVSSHPAVGTQYADWRIDPETFRREIAPARTVGFLEEVEALRRQGLARGATAELAVVIGPRGYLGPLRFPDEVARHKVLDVVGDLALAGFLRAHVIALRSGHALNAALARKIREGLQSGAVREEGGGGEGES